MADYISREAAKRLLISDYAYAAATLLDKVPSADVEPVRNAAIQQTTIDEYYGTWGMCTECGYEDNTVSAKYCGGCGARLIWRVK